MAGSPRPAGLEPVAAEAFDADAYKAVQDAARKLDRALDRRLGRARSRG